MGVINLAEIQQQFPNIQNLTPLAVASGLTRQRLRPH